jgi:RNA-binding protein Nova
MSDPAEGKRIAIKMLLSNNMTGSLIGAGGKSIKELQAVTGAKVHVSSNTEPFPGTSDRVVVLSGPYESVSLTHTLIWELIALVTSAENAKEVEWSPQAMLAKLGENDAVDVIGKLTVPAAAGGLILGRGGANIRSLSEESGCRVNMTSKDEALFTQERVITLVGTAASCMKCTNMILRKLEEPDEIMPYTNRYARTHTYTHTYAYVYYVY